MSSAEHKQLIWNYIKDIEVGMLVTKEYDDDNSMRARPMQLVQEEYDGTLYFYTSKKDSKVFEIKQDQDICITFSDPNKNIYVSLTGKAQVTEDKELIDKYWSPTVAAWFKNGKEDPNLSMLKVKINRGEHWDSNENRLFKLYEIAKANVLESETANIGENEKFGVS